MPDEKRPGRTWYAEFRKKGGMSSLGLKRGPSQERQESDGLTRKVQDRTDFFRATIKKKKKIEINNKKQRKEEGNKETREENTVETALKKKQKISKTQKVA